MGKLTWAKELAKKGGSKIADIKKKKEISKKLKPKDSLTAREKKAKKAWKDSVTASHDRRHKFKQDQVDRIEKVEAGKTKDDSYFKSLVDRGLIDRQYLKGK
tara:strand:+ start:600 stop:905 length:306 start_codon:yes stop_codon:yes gene_type:complete